MTGVDILLRTPAVTLMLSHEPPVCGQDSGWSADAMHDVISIVEIGSIAVSPPRAAPGSAWLLAPGTVFVAPRGADLSCRRVDPPTGHRCLSVSYCADAVHELREMGLPMLTLSAARATARQRFLRRRLRNLYDTPAACDASLRLDLLAGALYESVVDGHESVEFTSAGVATAAIRHIAGAADFIEAEFARPIKLVDIARVAEMSTFHFARTFARLTGVPPHRYLVATRLREALRRIEGGDSVTTACYAVGFMSPSHFTTAFRQYFGVLPSTLRHDRTIARLRTSLGTSVWYRRPGARSGSVALGA